MVDSENNSNGKSDSNDVNDEKIKSENFFRILDDLLSHTNSSRRLFLIFIGSALFFGPAALVLGGVLLGHPDYNIRHLEALQIGDNQENMSHIPGGTHLQLVTQNGTIIREYGLGVDRSHTSPILLGLRIFIVISVIFAAILLFIAIKEYQFFSHWNKRFMKYKSLNEKVDRELGED